MLSKKSKGYKCIIGKFEYFTIENGNLYRAPSSNPIMPDGYRGGARWQAPIHMVNQHLDMLKEQFAQWEQQNV